MKHLIETTDLSSLPITKYDRLILDSTTNEIVCKGGVIYEYVDLGLPSGLKWAKCNVGAETETDYGDFFMWGSTKPNTADECTWANSPFNGGDSYYNDEYFTTHKSEWLNDNENLKPEYDAAAQIMGGNWRMPTEADFQELVDNTTKEWAQVNGVNGYKFTSNKEGYQDNSIFIPAAGCCYNGLVKGVGIFGGVWSSSLRISDPEQAYDLYFESDSCYMYDGGRYEGWSMRGVCE